MPHLLARCLVSPAWEDELGGLLAVYGCVGVQSVDGALQQVGSPGGREARVQVELVFPAPASDDGTQQLELVLQSALDELASCGIEVALLGLRVAPDTDWLAVYRASARPIRVGRIWIDPRDPSDGEGGEAAPPGPFDGDAGDELLRLHLPAEQAFGTGSHETTQAMLLLLQQRPPQGQTVLDVGCGTGVLCFAAVALGARRALGLEVDVASTFVARRNAERNRFPDGVASSWVTGTIDCLAPPGSAPARSGHAGAAYDRVLVNVLPHRIAGQEQAIAAQVAAGGELWVGGLLNEQIEELTLRWQTFDLRCQAVETRGDWATLVLRREVPETPASGSEVPARG